MNPTPPPSTPNLNSSQAAPSNNNPPSPPTQNNTVIPAQAGIQNALDPRSVPGMTKERDPDFLLDKLLTGTYTLTDALRRLRTVKQFLLNQVFASAISSFSADSEADSAWLSSLGTEFYSEFNQQNIYQKMATLESQIRSIQPLIIYLPFEIPQGEIVRVGMRLRKDYGKHFLVDFKIDPNLIAGPAFVWKSVYKDYSIRARIEENRSQILSIIKEYLK